jgi:hypothetical protein
LSDTIIVIPAFNEEQSIYNVVQSVLPYCRVVVVDDGSLDTTSQAAKSAGAHVVTLSRNQGYELALQRGFVEAQNLGARYIITYDADGQFEASIIETFIHALEKDHKELVLGQRVKSARIGELIFNTYTKLRFGVGDILCGMKGYNIELFHKHGRFDHGQSVGTELAFCSLRRGVSFALVPVKILPRQIGHSQFGRGLKANLKILSALIFAIRYDIGLIAST